MGTCEGGEGWGARKETCPRAQTSKAPSFFFFFVKVLAAKNDALFMGPKGEERLWPK